MPKPPPDASNPLVPATASLRPAPFAPQRELTRSVEQLFPVADQLPEPRPASQEGRARWWGEWLVNWVVLVLALTNLALVVFDATYLAFRHDIQQMNSLGIQARGGEALKAEDRGTPKHFAVLPDLVAFYDPIRGIEPHRETDGYLKAAEGTFRLLDATPDHPDAAKALIQMATLSEILIKDDPFQDNNLPTKDPAMRGTWEKCKKLMKEHMRRDSTTQSFKLFWSKETLRTAHLALERQWFDREIAPLLRSNYWQTYNENGRPNNVFWKIDFVFSGLILLEFVLRGMVGVRRRTYPSFKAFFTTRWYDAVYVLPLIQYVLPAALHGPIHLLRMISVGYRMQRLGLINPVAVAQAKTARILDVITDLVNIKLLSNYQATVQKFDLAAQMQGLTPTQRHQLTALIEKNLSMVIGKVLPDVAPHLEHLITRAAYQALEQSPAYQQFKRLPGVGLIPEQLIPTLVAETMAGTQMTLLKAINDPENVRLTNEMIDSFTASLLRHMAEVGTEREIKGLLIAALEEEKRKIMIS